MTQIKKARLFHAMHTAADPLRLYNVWDAATAQAAVRAGSQAVATGSFSVAAAQGYADGQVIPYDFLLRIISRITACVDVPVSVDFECGYADDDAALAKNIRALIDVGVVGINFEDQDLETSGLVPIEQQSYRIRVIGDAAKQAGVPLFINARTDLFLQEKDSTRHEARLSDAERREAAYRAAGASGFFAPGLGQMDLIKRLAKTTGLPLNVMFGSIVGDAKTIATSGVSRISHGPGPYRQLMDAFENAAVTALKTED
jgi:2-methylisocitrate lyase-like PEP mutase family enzyme